jgi:integrase
MMFAYTGLRVDELRQLKWIDVQLEGSPICKDPHIQLRPEANKARRADIIPIPLWEMK